MADKKQGSNALNSLYPLAYVGAIDAGASAPVIWKNRAPRTTDYKNFVVGHLWIDISILSPTDPNIYILARKQQGVATWVLLNNAFENVDEVQIFYVGKHGSDNAAHDGKNIGKAKLTIQAGINAAAASGSPAVVYVLDKGTYAETLTGAPDVNIFAPNITLEGAGHTLANGNTWTIGQATITDGLIGFTFDELGGAANLIMNFIDGGVGSTLIDCEEGDLGVYVKGADVNNGAFCVTATSGRFRVSVDNLYLAGTSVAVGALGSGATFFTSNYVADDGSGFFYVNSLDAPLFEATVNQLFINTLSDIAGGGPNRLMVNALSGAALEVGAQPFDSVSGSTRIDGVPIGSNIPSTGAFATAQITTSTPHSVLLGQGASNITSLGEAQDGEIIIGVSGSNPVLGTLTAGAGINVINTPGGVEIRSTGGTGVGTRTAWSPTVLINGSEVGQTYSIQEGYYQVVGDIVFFSGLVQLATKGAYNFSDPVSLGGLPLQVLSSPGSGHLLMAFYASGGYQFSVFPVTGTTTLDVMQGIGAFTSLRNGYIFPNITFSFSGFYFKS